ncbi:hypothetical protein B0H21DRAFT_711028 [Amylocystis lapponica]|nr:hypothetical protein B0H21DRAFT_827045 [Amylocystis lapponica]KAH9939880.1 hypothetical protein B0H21DRAFT_711028 [Amylocystis lapponica]
MAHPVDTDDIDILQAFLPGVLPAGLENFDIHGFGDNIGLEYLPPSIAAPVAPAPAPLGDFDPDVFHLDSGAAAAAPFVGFDTVEPGPFAAALPGLVPDLFTGDLLLKREERLDTNTHARGPSPAVHSPSSATRYTSPADLSSSDDDNDCKIVDHEASGSKKEKKSRSKFTSDDLIQLAETAVAVNPWGAKYKERGKAWASVLSQLQAQGRFKDSTMDTIRNKMNDMIVYHANPTSQKGAAVDRELSTTAKVKLASKLDLASHQKAKAQERTDGEKDKARAKETADRIGGEAIRQSSMETLRKRKHADYEDTNDENQDAMPSKKKIRRLRSGSADDSSGSEFRQLYDLVKESEVHREKREERREDFEQQLIAQLKESTQVYAQVFTQCLNSLPQLLQQAQARRN